MTAASTGQTSNICLMTYVMTSYDMTHDMTYDTPNARCEVERDTEQPLAVVHTVEILGQ